MLLSINIASVMITTFDVTIEIMTLFSIESLTTITQVIVQLSLLPLLTFSVEYLCYIDNIAAINMIITSLSSIVGCNSIIVLVLVYVH